jgi:hypothetical protein
VDQSTGRKQVVPGHAAVQLPFESEYVMAHAHPVLTCAAESTLIAGHDLLGDDPIPD